MQGDKSDTLADLIFRNFKVRANPMTRVSINSWEQRLIHLFASWRDQITSWTHSKIWDSEVVILQAYCADNCSDDKDKNFDPKAEFVPFINRWKFSYSPKTYHTTGKTPNTEIVILAPTKIVKRPEVDDFTLTDALLDQLNLNPECEDELRSLEQALIDEIEGNVTKAYVVQQVRIFCRKNAGKGFYDPRYSMVSLCETWYDAVIESFSAYNSQEDIERFVDAITGDDANQAEQSW